MLSEPEQRRLAEIESWFQIDDPAFASGMTGRRPRRPREQRHRVMFLVLAVVGAVVATMVATMADGPPAGIAAGLTVCAIAVGRYLSGRQHQRDTSPPVS